MFGGAMAFGLRRGQASKKSSAADRSPSRKGSPARSSEGAKTALTVNEFVARTKRCRERGLEPTKPELISYAKYLGIDPVIDGDLMWISDEALKAPLPSEWTEHHDSAERIFYYNVQTHESSWTHPLEHLHRDTYKSIVNFRSGNLTKEEQAAELEKLRHKCDDCEREAHKELQSWTEHTDEQGQKFFYNKDTKCSVWTDPRPARCHSLYLQMKALRVLSKHCGQLSPRAGIGYEQQRQTEQLAPAQLPPGAAEPVGNDCSELQPPHAAKLSPCAAPEKGGGGRGDVLATMGTLERERQKRKKKGKDSEHKVRDRSHSQCPSGIIDLSASGEMRRTGGFLDMKKKSGLLDFKHSATEELRGTLGVSGSLPLLGSTGLHSPTGDGLSNVGRAKVRAGIRLEPLQGGA